MRKLVAAGALALALLYIPIIARAEDLAGEVVGLACADDGQLLRWLAGLFGASVAGSAIANFRDKLPGPLAWVVDLVALNFVKTAKASAEAAVKVAPVLLLAVALAACAQAGKPLTGDQLRANLENAKYLLHAAGCGVAMAGTIAAPFVSMAADAEGNQILAAVDTGGAILCKVTVPPMALPMPAAANAPAATAALAP